MSGWQPQSSDSHWGSSQQQYGNAPQQRLGSSWAPDASPSYQSINQTFGQVTTHMTAPPSTEVAPPQDQYFHQTPPGSQFYSQPVSRPQHGGYGQPQQPHIQADYGPRGRRPSFDEGRGGGWSTSPPPVPDKPPSFKRRRTSFSSGGGDMDMPMVGQSPSTGPTDRSFGGGPEPSGMPISSPSSSKGPSVEDRVSSRLYPPRRPQFGDSPAMGATSTEHRASPAHLPQPDGGYPAAVARSHHATAIARQATSQPHPSPSHTHQRGGETQWANPYFKYINQTAPQEIPARILELCRGATSTQECVVGVATCIIAWKGHCDPVSCMKAMAEAYCQRTVPARTKLAIVYIFNDLVQKQPREFAAVGLRYFLQVIPPLVAACPFDVQQSHCRVLDVLKDRGVFPKEQMLPLRKAFQQTPVSLEDYMMARSGQKRGTGDASVGESPLESLTTMEETNPTVRGKILASLRALRAYAFEPRISDPAVTWAQHILSGVGDLQTSDEEGRRSLGVAVTRARDFCSMELEIIQYLLLDWAVAVEENRLRLLKLTSTLIQDANTTTAATTAGKFVPVRRPSAGGSTSGLTISTPTLGSVDAGRSRSSSSI